jgi:hypothetical protein
MFCVVEALSTPVGVSYVWFINDGTFISFRSLLRLKYWTFELSADGATDGSPLNQFPSV